MTLWALLISIAYVPGWTGVVVQTGWVLMSLTVPFMIWRGLALAWPLQALGLLTAAYAVASMLWAPSQTYAVFSLWIQFCIGLTYILGAKLSSEALDRAMHGFAIGIGASSLFCIPQALGWNPTYVYDIYQPSGLFYNPASAGIAFAIMSLWVFIRGYWLYLPLFVPGLWLNQTRSFWFMLGGVALIWAARRSRYGAIALAVCTAAIAWYLFHPLERDTVRIALWSAIFSELKPLGWGPGILYYIMLPINGVPVRPEYAHNEYLDFVIQYGVGAIPLFILIAIPIFVTNRPEWYVYVALLIAGLYSYPTHSAPLAAIGALLAGHLSRDWDLVRAHCTVRRLAVGLWHGPARSKPTHQSGASVPV